MTFFQSHVKTLILNLGTLILSMCPICLLGTVLDADGNKELTEPEVCMFYYKSNITS